MPDPDSQLQHRAFGWEQIAGAASDINHAIEDGAFRVGEEAGLPLDSAQIAMEPSTTIELDRAGAGPVLKLLDALEDLDDVQEVHSNFDVPDDVMAELAAG